MPFEVPKSIKPPNLKTESVKDWMNGVVDELDDGRTPINGLRSATNMTLEQDGVLRPRPSLKLFGPQPEGEILGELFQFRSITGLTTTNKIICMQKVTRSMVEVGRIFVAEPEDIAWTEITTEDYSITAKAHYLQLDKKVIILNGEDEISYLDITDDTITSYTTITDPGAPTLTPTGLTGSSFNIYYMITANSKVGETAGTQQVQAISKSRDLWDGTTENIKVTWSTVTGVQGWNLYCSVTADGDGTPKWGLLASNLSADTLEFTDTGTVGTGALNYYKTPPDVNSTAGPKASRGEVINGRLWLTGDKNNPYYIWYGGDFAHELDFTPANGGGFVQVGSGTREIPSRVFNFRTGPGDPIIKALTKGVNGQGKRYSIASNTLTYSGTPIVYWAATEDYGFSGTDSPDGLILYGNNAYYPSRDGFKTIGTKPQLQNLLSIDGISDTILSSLDFLNSEAMDGVVGVGFENRLYWALPVGADYNNEIWVNDLGRNGAWMKPWSVRADWLTLIADNQGKSHLVVVQDDQIFEFDRKVATSDNGEPFITAGTSGFNQFSESGQEWARLIKVIITVLRPKGKIDFAIDGFTNKGVVERLGTKTLELNASSTSAGWSEAGWSDFGWSDFSYTADITPNASKEVVVKINKDVQFWAYSWSSQQAGVDYAISRIVPVFVTVGIKNLK